MASWPIRALQRKFSEKDYVCLLPVDSVDAISSLPADQSLAARDMIERNPERYGHMPQTLATHKPTATVNCNGSTSAVSLAISG